eukprot:gnl/TRDRNA2_/TRDRNA2_42351_c0_seq1.p1 gnl/TRDRNA2_/TRDRNA2_42351_c0~~gnl/TRDRNA2_/TRDRNA2_42351_c0_seq1.p1  ORF type:complete len:422 (+),score=76.69 gnl/TRDRNA2_/TRDRNA2_42351_c0_seq1:93-1358(+)
MNDIGHYELSNDDDEGNIRILQITDLHHMPADLTEFDLQRERGRTIPIPGTSWSFADGYSTTKDVELMKTIISRVKPHLVVMTGNIIEGRAYGKNPDPNGWKKPILEVLAPIIEAEVPWTFIPGTADNAGAAWKRDSMIGIYKLGDEAPKCVSKDALSFNHTFTIGFSGERDKMSIRIWLFDSGSRHPDAKFKYYSQNPFSVDGYQKLNAADLLGPSKSELVFTHLSFQQSKFLEPARGVNKTFEASLRAGRMPPPFCWDWFIPYVRWLNHDKIVDCSELDTGLWDHLVEFNKVRAVCSGHDHFCDAAYYRDKIWLLHGRPGGATPPIDWEGDAGALPFEIGARVLKWVPQDNYKEGAWTTWCENEKEKEEDSEIRMCGQLVPSKLPGGLDHFFLSQAMFAVCFFVAFLSFVTFARMEGVI